MKSAIIIRNKFNFENVFENSDFMNHIQYDQFVERGIKICRKYDVVDFELAFYDDNNKKVFSQFYNQFGRLIRTTGNIEDVEKHVSI